MNHFLDASGLTYLWGKIKATFSTITNTVTSLGTSGNYLTWTKNGTTNNITVPYATKAAQDNDGNAISTTYLKLGEPLMPTNTFSGDQKKFYLEPVMDCLWAADKRFITSVTITDANQNVTSVSSSPLFKGNYGGTTNIKAGDDCTIKITIQANGNVDTGYITTYVQGYLMVDFYYYGLPKSISGRIYSGDAGSKAWKNISFDKQKGDQNGIYISPIGLNYYASIIELNIECQTLATDPYMTMVSSVEWWNTRASVNQYPFVNKYGAQTLYYLLTANGGITVPSDKTITIGGKAVLTDHQDISGLVPNTRKVNGKALSADITLTASDVGALPSSTAIPDELADLSDDSTHRLVTDAEKSTWNGKGSYSKPSDGIPRTDLESSVQNALAKAYTALQSESDPVFSASAAYGITSSDITNWNSKTSNVGTITGITMNGASKGTSGVVNLGTVITAHQDISGKADKTATVSNVTYDTSAMKFQKKINGSTTDIVSLDTLRGGYYVLDGSENLQALQSGIYVANGTLPEKAPSEDNAYGYFEIFANSQYRLIKYYPHNAGYYYITETKDGDYDSIIVFWRKVLYESGYVLPNYTYTETTIGTSESLWSYATTKAPGGAFGFIVPSDCYVTGLKIDSAQANQGCRVRVFNRGDGSLNKKGEQYFDVSLGVNNITFDMPIFVASGQCIAISNANPYYCEPSKQAGDYPTNSYDGAFMNAPYRCFRMNFYGYSI